MASTSRALCLIFGIIGVIESGISLDPQGSTVCEFYDKEKCVHSHEGCSSVEECKPPPPGKRNHCFVVWKYNNVTNEETITLKGCILDRQDCYDKPRCIDDKPARRGQFLHCCCDNDMCNENFEWSLMPTATTTTTTTTKTTTTIAATTTTTQKINHDQKPNRDVYYDSQKRLLSVFILVFVLTGISVFYFCDKNKIFCFSNKSLSVEHSPISQTSLMMISTPVKLLGTIARGRFGTIWKAHLYNQIVAVKVFPMDNEESWKSEQEIFQLPHMDHENILHFIGVEKRGDGLQTEFWLLTTYHTKGSLCDYLKGNLVNWNEMCKIAESIAKGLKHLHDEIPGNKFIGCKPAIAHRDLKSRNVLIKADMTACLADFGLAIVFQPEKYCGAIHAQVGTPRYMAPEVLDGAINFTKDSFFRIDMYAFGLVLWELASRCNIKNVPVADYILPFEHEAGNYPTIEDMQKIVVVRKERPLIPKAWRSHIGLSSICDTIEDCWDHDAEARITSHCVADRITNIRCPSIISTVSITIDK